MFLLYLTAVYGASIIKSIDKTDENTNDLFETENEEDTSAEIMNLLDDPIEIDSSLTTNSLSGFEMGENLAEVAKSLLRIISKMDLTREGLQNVIQLVLALITPYFGMYADVIVSMVSGIATVLMK